MDLSPRKFHFVGFFYLPVCDSDKGRYADNECCKHDANNFFHRNFLMIREPRVDVVIKSTAYSQRRLPRDGIKIHKLASVSFPYPLQTANCKLQTAYCYCKLLLLLPTANCLLPTATATANCYCQ